MLKVDGLRAGYGPLEVLHGLDFEVADGQIVVVLGANGAGKTTTMKALSGQLARSGSVHFDGTDLSKARADAILRAGIAQVPEGRGTFPDLSVEENLQIGAYTRKGDIDDDLARWMDVFPRLGERRKQQAGSLSGGEQQMLAIARALMSHPKLLLLDEPSQGLAPLITQSVFEQLATLNDEMGTSILLVEQNAKLALQLADHAYVMETGSIVASGPADELAEDEAIKRAYLGI